VPTMAISAAPAITGSSYSTNSAMSSDARRGQVMCTAPTARSAGSVSLSPSAFFELSGYPDKAPQPLLEPEQLGVIERPRRLLPSSACVL
jgi:hypothetical protein